MRAGRSGSDTSDTGKWRGVKPRRAPGRTDGRVALPARSGRGAPREARLAFGRPARRRGARMSDGTVRVIDRGGYEELHVSVDFPDGAVPAALGERLAALLPGDAAVVCAFVFGSRERHARVVQLLRRGRPEFPVTWAEGSEAGGREVDGLFVQAVRGLEVAPVLEGGRTIGSRFADADFEYVVLGGLGSAAGPEGGRAEQTREVLAAAERALAAASMELRHVVRTWFYNDRILEWYGEFNAVRTELYGRKGLLAGLIPASTGIEGAVPGGAALVAAVLAMKPRSARAAVRTVDSPVQCCATRYGSSFSRAVVITTGAQESMLVSGTASIDASGATVHPGELERQIDQTLESVDALLGHGGMGMGDVHRA